jgi:hypothetical protein
MSPQLRSRLWQTMEQHDQFFYHRPIPNDNWTEQTSTLECTEGSLRRVLGLGDSLFIVKNRQAVQALKEFVVRGSPVRALDTIEVFYSELGDLKPQRDFQRDLNEAMLAFGCPWRLADGHFFQVASEFIEREIIERAADLMTVAGFEGALDEFRAARPI